MMTNLATTLDIAPIPIRCRLVRCVVNNRPNLTLGKSHSLFSELLPATEDKPASPGSTLRTHNLSEQASSGRQHEDSTQTMHITASWEGVEEVVEVDEGCRSVAALLETVAAALPELDAETVCLEIGGCAADDEAVCGLCEGSVVTVSVLPAVRAAATLHEEGCNVDFDGFCRAARTGDLRRCRLYIEAGVECQTWRGDAPLHIACDNADIELCKLLIDAGCRLDISNISGDRPLHLAVYAKSAEVCKLLIDSGCALDVQNEAGKTPLHLAVSEKCGEVHKLLIDSGCAR